MTREATITQEQVNAAADAIRAGGSRPTARGVREALGGGSMATVLKLLQVWQGRQVHSVSAPTALPVGLQRALIDWIGQEVAGAKAELQGELVAAQQANGDLIAESERQAAELEINSAFMKAADEEIGKLNGRLYELQGELDRKDHDVVNERLAAELARTELAKAQLRLEALPRVEAEVDRLRIELENERSGKVAAEQAAAVALAKLEAMTERAKTAEAARVKAENQAEKATQDLNNSKMHVQAQQTALDTAARECEDLRRAAKDAKAEAKKSGEEAALLRGQLGVMFPDPPPVPAQKTRSRTVKE